MTITIEMNQKIQTLQIIDNIYVCVCVCVATQIQLLKLPRCQKRYIIKKISY